MKFFVLLALLAFIGCNFEDEVVETKPANELLRYEPAIVSNEDLARINAICNALATKAERLPSLISSAFTFGLSEKNCEQAQLGAEIQENVTIQRPNLNYLFRMNNGDTFAFPDVETNIHGAMSEICANTTGLRSPIQTSSRGALWFTTFTSKGQCTSDFDSMCIHIKKGENVSELNYSIHTEEWIKFKIGTDKTGFYIERKLISRANCTPGKTFERQVRLR